jgi:hypothetical protein
MKLIVLFMCVSHALRCNSLLQLSARSERYFVVQTDNTPLSVSRTVSVSNLTCGIVDLAKRITSLADAPASR